MRLKLSPDRFLFVRNDEQERWYIWSPNGEYFTRGTVNTFESEDELTDEQTYGWPEARL